MASPRESTGARVVALGVVRTTQGEQPMCAGRMGLSEVRVARVGTVCVEVSRRVGMRRGAGGGWRCASADRDAGGS
eukprot:13759-Eustigmatos_ZCMA.PRE.1